MPRLRSQSYFPHSLSRSGLRRKGGHCAYHSGSLNTFLATKYDQDGTVQPFPVIGECPKIVDQCATFFRSNSRQPCNLRPQALSPIGRWNVLFANSINKLISIKDDEIPKIQRHLSSL